MFTDPRKDENKEKKYISKRKKKKVWLGRGCDNCGRTSQNLFQSFKIRSIELVEEDEDEICKRCINKRKKALKEMLTEMQNSHE